MAEGSASSSNGSMLFDENQNLRAELLEKAPFNWAGLRIMDIDSACARKLAAYGFDHMRKVKKEGRWDHIFVDIASRVYILEPCLEPDEDFSELEPWVMHFWDIVTEYLQIAGEDAIEMWIILNDCQDVAAIKFAKLRFLKYSLKSLCPNLKALKIVGVDMDLSFENESDAEQCESKISQTTEKKTHVNPPQIETLIIGVGLKSETIGTVLKDFCEYVKTLEISISELILHCDRMVLSWPSLVALDLRGYDGEYNSWTYTSVKNMTSLRSLGISATSFHNLFNFVPLISKICETAPLEAVIFDNWIEDIDIAASVANGIGIPKQIRSVGIQIERATNVFPRFLATCFGHIEELALYGKGNQQQIENQMPPQEIIQRDFPNLRNMCVRMAECSDPEDNLEEN